MEKKVYELSEAEFIRLAQEDILTMSPGTGPNVPIPEDTDKNEGEWDWE